MIEVKSGDITLDTSEEVKYMFTCTDTDYSDPAKINTTFTKTITFINSKNNNLFFGNVEYLITVGTKRKYDNIQITNNGLIIDRGYLILDSVDTQNKIIKYNCTFYSILGTFFNNLKTKNNKTLTLSDLNFGFTDDNGNEIDENGRLCLWNADYITSSWNTLTTSFLMERSKELKRNLTAVPCLSGGYEDFDNNKILTFQPTDNIKQLFGNITTSKWTNSLSYTNGWAKFELPRDVNEWEVRDLRSQYQRPAIKTSIILDAISDPQNNGGYKINWPKEIDNHFNNRTILSTLYNDTWCVLPRINFKDQDINASYEVTCTTDTFNVTKPNDNIKVKFNGDNFINTASFSSPKCQLSFNLQIPLDSQTAKRLESYKDTDAEIGYLAMCYDIFPRNIRQLPARENKVHYTAYAFIELIIDVIDSNGNKETKKLIVSDATTKEYLMFGGGYHDQKPGYMDYSKGVYVILETKFVPFYLNLNKEWFNEHEYFNTLFNIYNQATGTFISSKEITVDLNIPKDENVTINISSNYYTASYEEETPYEGFRGIYQFIPKKHVNLNKIYLVQNFKYKDEYFYDSIYYPNILSTLDNNVSTGYISQIYDTTNSVVQPVNLSKKMILTKTTTPLQFLLDFCRLANLKITFDVIKNEINILKIEDYYKSTINIDSLIDRSKQYSIKPTPLTSNLYTFKLPSKSTYVEYLYNIKNNQNYGETSIQNDNLSGNTDVFSKLCFNTTGDYKLSSPYFKEWVTDSVSGEYSIINKGTTVTTNIFTNEELENTEYQYHKNDNTSFDMPISLISLFDKDNKQINDNFNLVFLSSTIELPQTGSGIAVTDNLPIMYQLNEKPCFIDVYSSNNLTVNENITNELKVKIKTVKSIPYFSQFWLGNNMLSIKLYKDKLHTTKKSSICLNMFNNGSVDNLITGDSNGLYNLFYSNYYNNLNNENCYDFTCYVLLDPYQSAQSLLRNFYTFDGCLWVLNKIQDYDVSKRTTCKCTFIKVVDLNAYKYTDSNIYIDSNLFDLNNFISFDNAILSLQESSFSVTKQKGSDIDVYITDANSLVGHNKAVLKYGKSYRISFDAKTFGHPNRTMWLHYADDIYSTDLSQDWGWTITGTGDWEHIEFEYTPKYRDMGIRLYAPFGNTSTLTIYYRNFNIVEI